MFHDVSPAALALGLFLCSPFLHASLASEPDGATTLESVAADDSTLRAALKSHDKNEQKLREEFGRQLSALRKTRIQALEQAFSRAVNKRQADSVAVLAEVIKKTKEEQPGELITPEDQDRLIGTTLRWGSFAMFLAPNGVAWFVNMDAERHIHRFEWKPSGANAFKLKSTNPDPRKQNSTVTIDGERFSLQEDDSGTKESGAVFKP